MESIIDSKLVGDGSVEDYQYMVVGFSQEE
jgi:hypothetical protein